MAQLRTMPHLRIPGRTSLAVGSPVCQTNSLINLNFLLMGGYCSDVKQRRIFQAAQIRFGLVASRNATELIELT